MRGTIIFYGHSGCPSVPLVRMILEQSGAEFEYINIWADDLGRTRVRGINQGYKSVPTLVFPDGSTLTEPSAQILRNKLTSMPYESQPHARLGAIESLLKRIWERKLS